jgi:CDP-glucose 4,6-dehydratase
LEAVVTKAYMKMGFNGFFEGRKVVSLGADVVGLSIGPPTDPSLFEQLQLSDKVKDYRIDIRKFKLLKDCVMKEQPDVVFHLAAQSLVRESYRSPIETYEVNVIGTMHILEALRSVRKKVTAIMITTDKCYENQDSLHGYRETDPMGGFDPYSSSKGCAELLISSFRRSFFDVQEQPRIGVASVRAGNVIGGGDWANDRILPDAIRSLQSGKAIEVRNPLSTRPWQHVLEPLSGYMCLASMIGQSLESDSNPEILRKYTTGFNFGPNLSSNLSVRKLVEEILLYWDGSFSSPSQIDQFHEASKLNLVTDKAFHLLAWQPVWSFGLTVEKTVEWYKGMVDVSDPRDFENMTLNQINEYTESAKDSHIPWSN